LSFFFPGRERPFPRSLDLPAYLAFLIMLFVAKGAALVATLGTEPQVVFLAYQLLIQREEAIHQVLVFHTRSPKREVRAAVDAIKRTWPRWAPHSSLELIALPFDDLDSENALRRAYSSLREGIFRLKEQGLHLHLCISGGRKPLALAAFLTAQFLFGPEDKLWYLYSPPDVEALGMSVSFGDPRVKLIELPVPIWTELPLFLAAVSQYRDPWTAAEVQRTLIRQAERRRWAQFFEQKLTPAERGVVEALVLHGGSNDELARKLGKSSRTVGHQLASVYRKLRSELGEGIPIDRATVASLFAPILRA